MLSAKWLKNCTGTLKREKRGGINIRVRRMAKIDI
jgi:hypothetical protein